MTDMLDRLKKAVALPTPDNDDDFTPELGREAIALLQEINRGAITEIERLESALAAKDAEIGRLREALNNQDTAILHREGGHNLPVEWNHSVAAARTRAVLKQESAANG